MQMGQDVECFQVGSPYLWCCRQVRSPIRFFIGTGVHCVTNEVIVQQELVDLGIDYSLHKYSLFLKDAVFVEMSSIKVEFSFPLLFPVPYIAASRSFSIPRCIRLRTL